METKCWAIRNPLRQIQFSTPPSTGKDKTTANDLVSPNKSDMQHGDGMRPGFKSMDTNKNGHLIADDIKGDQWLSKSFCRCDSNHDGPMSQTEYSNCK